MVSMENIYDLYAKRYVCFDYKYPVLAYICQNFQWREWLEKNRHPNALWLKFKLFILTKKPVIKQRWPNEEVTFHTSNPPNWTVRVSQIFIWK